MKKISIVTPCFNAEPYIAETIQSVIGQRAVLNHSVELEYIICDGQSTDKTLEVARATLESAPAACTYKIISELDKGMYDALAKGVQLAAGEAIAYINAGDIYHPSAFEGVSEIIDRKLADWVTGYGVFYNEKSQIVEVILPYRYRREFFECGLYGDGLPPVQQESTFWTARLHRAIDWERLANLKYAGDYYLWMQFSQLAELKIVKSYLGGFKFHGGHLSQTAIDSVSASAYQLELRSLTRRLTPIEKLRAAVDRALWPAPYKLKKRLAGSSFLTYDRQRQAWAAGE